MVEGRDTGCSHSQQDFPVRDRWFWKIYELEILVAAEPFCSHCTHNFFLVTGRSPERARIRLHLCDPAIHKQFRSRDVAAVVGREKQRGLRDLIGGSKSAERDTAGDCLHDLIGTFYRTPRRRVRITWTYRIYPNAPTLQIRCPCPRERTYGGFCGAINTPLRRSFFGNDRRIQDDGGTIRHERKRLLYREEKTLHISVKK